MTPDPHAHSRVRPGGRTVRLTSVLARRWALGTRWQPRPPPGRGSDTRVGTWRASPAGPVRPRLPELPPPLGRGLGHRPVPRGPRALGEGPVSGLNPQKGAPTKPACRAPPGADLDDGMHAGSAPTRLGPALPRVQLRKPRPAVPAGSGLAPRLPGAGLRRVPWRGPAFGGGPRATAEAALTAAHSPCAPRLLPSWVSATRATAWLSVQVFRVLRLRILRAAQRPHQRVGLSFRLQAERPRKLHLCGALRNFQTSLELILGLSAFPEPPQF